MEEVPSMRTLLPGSESKRASSAARSGVAIASSNASAPAVRVQCGFVFIFIFVFRLSTFRGLTQFIPFRFKNNFLAGADGFVGFHRRDGCAETFQVTGRRRAMHRRDVFRERRGIAAAER